MVNSTPKRPVGRPTSAATTQVYFRLPNDILARVDNTATANGLSRTQYLRMIVTRTHTPQTDQADAGS